MGQVTDKTKKRSDRISRGIRKTLSLIAGLSGIPSSNRDQRGIVAQDIKAPNAAQYWQDRKIIRGWRRYKGLSPEDLAGRDLALILLNDERVEVQVKDFCNYKVFKECREKGTRPFFVWPDDGEEIANERMLNLIISAYLASLTPSQIHQVVAYILKIKQPQKPSLLRRIFSMLRKWKAR